MKCLEFRRLALEQPAAIPAEAQAHIRQCANCKQFYQKLNTQEAALAQALAVDVPEDLVAKIMLRQSFAPEEPAGSSAKGSHQGVKRGIIGFALAASIGVLAVMLNWLPLNTPVYEEHGATAELMIRHVEDESETLTKTELISMDTFRKTLQNVNLQAKADYQGITFAGNCIVDGILAAHFVVQTPEGPVTVLLMPNHPFHDPIDYSDKRWHVAMVPMKKGSAAFISPPGLNWQVVKDQMMAIVKV
ncbi:DUF3379 family protein [Zooshikella harenae]|uniref:DUF3379 family protein n=1 Tax=Zooshikella harenae TaxID=2827238 RepID=A0ABS5ZA69_9GAMM|nr:DUF3379 family protein [Zooshikella harenae]MBU2710951.1 DUF3379 family protein [Zooshikella harenae]